MTPSPNILVTNDDGIHSRGIFRLWETMEEIGNVIVGTLSRSRSHPVKLIGRKDLKYDESQPYAALRGEHHE